MTPFHPNPIAVRRREAAAMLSIGTSLLDELIASGRIDARKVGKNLLILVSSLEEYISKLPPAKLNSTGFYRKRSEAAEAAEANAADTLAD